MQNEKTAPTRNIALLAELVSRIQNRAEGLPGMGTFHGPSGYGKTKAVCCVAKLHRAYFVEMKSLWTRKTLLSAILSEMGMPQTGTMPTMLGQIGKQLALSKRPLILDEADHIVDKNMIEVVRDIYEVSQGTVVLVGEENLPAKLELMERVHGRMFDWVAAQPADMDDARKLAAIYCSSVQVSDCMLDRITKETFGSTRRICTNLARIAEFAVMNGLDTITAETYTGELFTGTPPAPRK